MSSHLPRISSVTREGKSREYAECCATPDLKARITIQIEDLSALLGVVILRLAFPYLAIVEALMRRIIYEASVSLVVGADPVFQNRLGVASQCAY